MTRSADRHLLFGLIALQTGQIRPDQLVAALQGWTADKARPLDDHLIALGHLDEAQRAAIDAQVDLHVKATEANLEDGRDPIPIGASTRAELAAILADDTDPDPDATRSAAVAGDDRSIHGIGPSPGGRRFRILRPHARGGLGAVYVALDSELNREVALKQILENHADNPVSRGRFLVEAEITGGLEHPGIVPVYGLGAHGDGRPYYAMRFVRGDTLGNAIKAFHQRPKTDSKRSLEFRALLRKLTDVCNTIEYAHARGVLHRDIKPANVIVGKHGQTLVVDWGLAKALGRAAADADERALTPSSGGGLALTLPGKVMGTPAYMSPEQARGEVEALEPRSDVYSLGATLYHLLTGRAPFERSTPAVLESVAAGAFPRPRAVDVEIDPALEAIVLKAMAREPADRYASARALADDIDRWMADERVEAFPEPWTRTLNRWLTRHRTSVTGAAAAGLVALAAQGVISVAQSRANDRLAATNKALDLQRQRAEANESQAIEAVKRFKDAIANNPELKDNPELDSLRKTLLKEPLAFFSRLHQRLEVENDARPESLRQLAHAANEHGMLIDEIGDREEAVPVLRQALDIFERLARDHPAVADYQTDLAASHNSVGDSLGALGRFDGARAAYARAVEIDERLARDHPAVADYQASLARALGSLGNLLLVANRLDEARTTFARAVEIDERLARDHPTVPDYQAGLAISHRNLGDLLREMGRTDEARTTYKRAIEIEERLARDHPAVADYQASLAISHNELGIVFLDTGRTDEARTTFARAIEIQDRLVREHPAVPDYQAGLAMSHNNLGSLLREMGRTDEARTSFARAIEIDERLARDHPAVPGYQAGLAKSHNNLGIVLRDTGRTDEARTTFARAIEIKERLARDHPAVADYQASLANSHNNLGVLLRDTGRTDEARTTFARAIEIQERLAQEHPDVPPGFQVGLIRGHNNLGDLLREMGRTDEARTTYKRAFEIQERLARDHPEMPQFASDFGGVLNNLAVDDLQASRFAEARQRLLEAIDWQRKALAASPGNHQCHQFLKNHLANLIVAERGLGHEDEAGRVERELSEFRLNVLRWADVEARLQAVLAGEAPRENDERLALAGHAYDTRRFHAAARLWDEVFNADPKLAENRQFQHPYNAARAAALAAAGKGSAPPGDDADKARLRGLALGWLKAELEIWSKLLESAQAEARQAIAPTLQHWRTDPDLAGVRDPDALAKLPEGERTEWEALWRNVDELLAKTE